MAEKHEDGGLTALVMQCAFSILAGQATVTISATGKRPKGFPAGELLSVGTDGSHNYAVDPVKALAWIHAITSTRNAGVVAAAPAQPFEARRWCKGDDAWTNWRPCTEADATRYRAQGMEVRRRPDGVTAANGSQR